MGRKRYTDEFRANAVVMLQGAGYPDIEGGLTRVAKHLGVPRETLRRWYLSKQNPPPPELVTEKKANLQDLLRKEIEAALNDMPSARQDAGYRDMGTVLGILIDKLQLLDGKATERLAIEDELTDVERASRIAALFDAARARRDGRADSELVQ